MRAAGEQENDNHRLQPCATRPINAGFNHHRPRRQQHGIYRRKIVILAMQHEERGEADQIAPSQQTIRPESRRKQKREYSCEPNRRGQGIHQQCLLKEKFSQRQYYVPRLSANAAHQLQKRPVIMNIPE